MDAERKLAERFREYANGKMVEGSDLARAAAYLEKLADENGRLLHAHIDRDEARHALHDARHEIERLRAEVASLQAALKLACYEMPEEGHPPICRG